MSELAGTAAPSQRVSRHAPGRATVETRTKSPTQKKRNRKKKEEEGPSRAEIDKEDKTRGKGEAEGGTCGGSDLQCAHPGCERDERLRS